MQLTHAVDFTFALTLSQAAAVDFVQDVQTSLSRASFIENLEVHQNIVTASLPVNAALFGQQLLHFRSKLVPTVKGARLEPLSLETDPEEEKQVGWAEVAGDAFVKPLPQGSEVSYHFDITIHLLLPTAEKWGGRALTRMIEFTAKHVLETITSGFPKAVQEAAKEVEKAYSKL